jgi:hypothetical protein
MAVDGITGLVKGGGDGLAALTLNGLAFILEFHKVFLRDVQDRVFLDFVHIECVFEFLKYGRKVRKNKKAQNKIALKFTKNVH